MLSVPAEAAVQAKRERFKLERIRAMEVAVLQSTTVFVERYLREVTIWSFDDKDQNSLTLEVSCMCLSLTEHDAYGNCMQAVDIQRTIINLRCSILMKDKTLKAVYIVVKYNILFYYSQCRLSN